MARGGIQKKNTAHLQAGRAEIKKDPISQELVQTADLMQVDIPEESAFLMAMDNLQNQEVKETVLTCFRDTHEHRKGIMTQACARAEARADRANEAYISRKCWEQHYKFAGFVLLLVAFVVCLLKGASPWQLLTFAIFVVGPGSVYLFKYLKKDKEKPRE